MERKSLFTNDDTLKKSTMHIALLKHNNAALTCASLVRVNIYAAQNLLKHRCTPCALHGGHALHLRAESDFLEQRIPQSISGIVVCAA